MSHGDMDHLRSAERGYSQGGGQPVGEKSFWEGVRSVFEVLGAVFGIFAAFGS